MYTALNAMSGIAAAAAAVLCPYRCMADTVSTPAASAIAA